MGTAGALTISNHRLVMARGGVSWTYVRSRVIATWVLAEGVIDISRSCEVSYELVDLQRARRDSWSIEGG